MPPPPSPADKKNECKMAALATICPLHTAPGSPIVCIGPLVLHCRKIMFTDAHFRIRSTAGKRTGRYAHVSLSHSLSHLTITQMITQKKNRSTDSPTSLKGSLISSRNHFLLWPIHQISLRVKLIVVETPLREFCRQ